MFFHFLCDAQTQFCIVNLAVQCVANRCGFKVDETHLNFLEWIATEVPFSAHKEVSQWLHESWGKAKVE